MSECVPKCVPQIINDTMIYDVFVIYKKLPGLGSVSTIVNYVL